MLPAFEYLLDFVATLRSAVIILWSFLFQQRRSDAKGFSFVTLCCWVRNFSSNRIQNVQECDATEAK